MGTGCSHALSVSAHHTRAFRRLTLIFHAVFQIGLLVYSDETEYRIRLALVKAKENMKDPNNLDELKSFIATTTARYICPKTLLKMMHTMEQMEAMEQRDQVHSALKRFYLDIGQADLGSDRDRSLRGKVMVASSTQQLLNAIIASGTSHLVSSRERYTQAWLARTKRIQEMEEKEKEIGRYRFID